MSITTTTPQVCTKRDGHGHPRAVDIGATSRWANPFPAASKSKEVSCQKQFRQWLTHSPDVDARWMRNNIAALVGQDLICDCGRDHCHGEVLLELAAQTAASLPAPVGWLRVTLTLAGKHTRFGLGVSGYGPDDVVVDTSSGARWMLGKNIQDVIAWVHGRRGTIIRADAVHEYLAKRDKALAVHPAGSGTMPRQLEALNA